MMKLLCKRFVVLLLVVLVFPAISNAQLSSENFVIQGQSVGSANQTTNASSTNFDADIESGGLYQIDTSVTSPSSPSNSGVTKTNSGNGNVLGKTDSVSICHSSNGLKYKLLNNVQVFIVLATSGAEPELRGHDGHDEDIVPPFQYDFGDGVRTYVGKNWTASNQQIFTSACKNTPPEPGPVEVVETPQEEPEVPVELEDQVVVCDESEIKNQKSKKVVVVQSQPPCSVTDDDSVQVPNELEEIQDVVDELVITETLPDLPEDAELLMLPIEVYVLDENGNPVSEFETPIVIDVVNPKVLGLTEDDLLILQPREDGDGWESLPFEVEGDTLHITIERPGQLLVWLLPKKAEAAELTPLTVSTETPPIEVEVPLWLAQLLQFLGLGAGIVYLLSQLSKAPFSVIRFRRMLLEGWRNLITLITFKKRHKPWGTVYDSVTKAPLDPAYVELFDLSGEKQEEAITDLDGRYGFLVPEGIYTMTVRKSHFSFPSRDRKLSGKDVLYSSLYYGGEFNVSAAVAHDIPMDPVEFDWNQYEKIRTGQVRYFHMLDPYIIKFLDLFFYLGLVLMIWQFVQLPDVMSGVLLIFYAILFVARIIGDKPLLYGSVTKDGQPLQFALVKIMKGEHVISTKVTDAYGRYVAIVQPGTYTVNIDERTEMGEYQNIWSRDITEKSGAINSRISI